MTLLHERTRDHQERFQYVKSPWHALVGFAMAVLMEGSMGVLFYGVFSETMGLASNIYLCDLPGIGRPFCALDENASVSHLLAFLLAVFSISVPMMIWATIIRERIDIDPRAWLARPINRMRAGLALSVYGAVVLLEVVNLYTMIAQQTVGNPFGAAVGGGHSTLTTFLAENQGLAIFVAILIAKVNVVLALITVRTSLALKSVMRG